MRTKVTFSLLAAVFFFGATTAHAAMACWMYTAYYSECVSVGGETTCWWHPYGAWQCISLPGGGGNILTPPDEGPVPGGSEYDGNMNGIIDDWHAVVGTNDPCSLNFTTYERVSPPGGPNTLRDHNGVDITANEFDPIYPFKNGTVSLIGDTGDSCGYHVKISHTDGSAASYCHMESFSSSLRIGQHVYAGYTQLGQVDHTGHIIGSPGDHLHISFSLDGSYSPDSMREFFQYVDNPPGPQFFDDGGC